MNNLTGCVNSGVRATGTPGADWLITNDTQGCFQRFLYRRHIQLCLSLPAVECPSIVLDTQRDSSAGLEPFI